MTARAPSAGLKSRSNARSTGYSGTPLARKLGISQGDAVFLIGAPDNYRDLVDPLPDGVRFVRRLTPDTDIVHAFATRRVQLEKAIAAARPKLKSDGVIWASWPKKSSGVETDITEDTIREIALPMGLVDVKVCAIDEVWSGLKLVIRKENRSQAK
jgi:hypothetical protein